MCWDKFTLVFVVHIYGLILIMTAPKLPFRGPFQEPPLFSFWPGLSICWIVMCLLPVHLKRNKKVTSLQRKHCTNPAISWKGYQVHAEQPPRTQPGNPTFPLWTFWDCGVSVWKTHLPSLNKRCRHMIEATPSFVMVRGNRQQHIFINKYVFYVDITYQHCAHCA